MNLKRSYFIFMKKDFDYFIFMEKDFDYFHSPYKI